MQISVTLASFTLSVATCLLTLVCSHSVMNTTFAQIKGQKQTCQVEGKRIVLTDSPHLQCFDCTCKSGEVQCVKRKCPDIDGCYLFENSTPRECCQKCKGCVRNNLHYNSGAVWTESKYPCKRFTCIAGVITESTVQCYTPCDDPVPPKIGQCCPTCSYDCSNNASVFSGTNALSKSNPCISCECQSNLLTCTKQSCPVLNCPKSSIVYDFEQCCPRCQGFAKITVPPRGACLLGSVAYPSGKQFTFDECTKCSCDNSTVTCERINCPILKCERDKQKIGPGECCASCIGDDDDNEDSEIESDDEQEIQDDKTPSGNEKGDDDEHSEIESDDEQEIHQNDKTPSGNEKGEGVDGCVHSNKTYEEGETWDTPDCQTCVCKQGQISCSLIMCPAINCPDNSMLKVTKGQCCPSCVENHAVCTIFGGSHFRTFDEKLYAFVGSCKYQLVSDCAAGSFNVRVKFLTSSNNDAAVKRLFMKVNNVRVDVQYNKNVRVNDRMVGLPYRMHGKLDIDATRDSVIVSTVIGVKIRWNLEGFLEVKVPQSYRGNVCGLCGNFNSLVEDDLTTREGILVQSPAIFAQSWTVGDESCFDTREYEVRACNSRRDQRLCNYIRGSVFRNCLRKINVTSYYESCLRDMCQCSPNDLQCHCESFDNYVRDCRLLGINLPRWRKSVGC